MDARGKRGKKTEELYSESGAAGKRKKRRGKKAEVTAEGSKHTWLNTCPRGKSIQRAVSSFLPSRPILAFD